MLNKIILFGLDMNFTVLGSMGKNLRRLAVANGITKALTCRVDFTGDWITVGKCWAWNIYFRHYSWKPHNVPLKVWLGSQILTGLFDLLLFVS